MKARCRAQAKRYRHDPEARPGYADRIPSQSQRCNTKKSDDGWRRAVPEAPEDRVLRESGDLLGGECRQSCGREKRPKGRDQSAGDARDLIADEGSHNEHRTRCQVGERDRRAEHGRRNPARLVDDGPLDQRQSGLAAAESQETDHDEPNE